MSSFFALSERSREGSLGQPSCGRAEDTGDLTVPGYGLPQRKELRGRRARGASEMFWGDETPRALRDGISGLGGWAPLIGVASREPNLEGTSPSPIPVAASPSGQLR